MTSCFRNFEEVIIEHLMSSDDKILIAMSWFTHKNVFNQILKLLSKGVSCSLIINDDFINNRKNGLKLDVFIKLGGQLFFPKNKKLMHDKFLIIDNTTCITGSLNWTYRAMSKNFENIVIFNNKDLILNFCNEFDRIKSNSNLVTKIKYNQKPVSPIEFEILHEELFFENKEEILSLISEIEDGNINSWFVKPGERAFLWDNCIAKGIHRFGFDKATIQMDFTVQNTPTELNEFYSIAYQEKKRNSSYILNKYFNDVSIGDVFFAANGRTQIIGIGIVLSGPKRYKAEYYKTYRKVNWIASFQNDPINLEDKISMDAISHLRFNNNWEQIKNSCT